MLFRVAIATETLTDDLAALCNAFQACSGDVEVAVLPRHRRKSSSGLNGSPTSSRLPRTLAGLFAYRPHLVISNDHGPAALQAALYRQMAPQSRFLLCAVQPSTSPPAVLTHRAIRRAADAVLSSANPVAEAFEQLRLPACLLAPAAAPGELDSFLACPQGRSETEARRIVFAGELSPQAGAADLMIAVASWAERNPSRGVEIWWVGSGDLAGVLDAQPLPPGMSQRFLGRLDRRAMAATFAQCGMLAVPSLVDSRSPVVLEALAAGLPVLGSRMDRNVRRWVEDGVTGWLFDALEPETVMRALGRALNSSLATLEQMRGSAQTTVSPVARAGLTERFTRAFGATSSEFPAALASLTP